MTPKIYIQRELLKLEELYNKASSCGDNTLLKMYAKLAMIELCGWTEECMDELVIGVCRRRRLTDPKNIAHVKEEIIKKNYGFAYDRNFRLMLMKTIGIVDLDYIERNMNQKKMKQLQSALSRLKPERDNHAHQTIRTTQNFTAPSICISDFKNIHAGLQEYEKWLKKL